ncbi:MAG: IPTL-CTERM sorting domain-containing protein [Candidatus Zixiibacteriota bacterium]
MTKRSFCLLIALATILLAVVAEPVLAQQSTTGPFPPPGIDRGIRPTTRAQVVVPGVPAYLWHHGCGPTAVGMVVGYWDGKGFPNLVPGDASTQTAAVDAMIADDRDTADCTLPDGDHYQDYSCPLDSVASGILPDKSQTGGAHTSNCVGDFFMTSWSLRNNYYGWSWFSDVPGSFTGYVADVEPEYTPVALNKTFSELNWAVYMAEIDSGNPVVMLVDINGDGDTDHFVTGIGYDDATMEYGIYDTWDTNIHWYLWRGLEPGNTWGIYGVTLFRVRSGPAIPSLSQWGLIVLVTLVIASGVLVMMRRRRAGVQA